MYLLKIIISTMNKYGIVHMFIINTDTSMIMNNINLLQQ